MILFLILKSKKIGEELNSIFVTYNPDLKKICIFRILNEIIESINTLYTHTYTHNIYTHRYTNSHTHTHIHTQTHTHTHTQNN